MHWLTKHWTTGQLNALVKKIGEENSRGILNDTRKFKVEARRILAPAGEVTFLKEWFLAGFCPAKFFTNQEDNLLVGNVFMEAISKTGKLIKSISPGTLLKFDLIEPATDLEILAELPDGSIFRDADNFCAYLAKMIDRQPDGRAGDLKEAKGINFFYVRGLNGGVFTVVVSFKSIELGLHSASWYISTTPFGGKGKRGDGCRIFSNVAYEEEF